MSIILKNGVARPGLDTGQIPSETGTFTCTVFSDVHHGDRNYNDFTCTNARKKLRQILRETTESECLINLGDFADYLKDGTVTFYDEAVAVLEEHDLCVYHPDNGACPEGKRFVYNVIGNHETAYVHKRDLATHIPYVEGIGCVYSFCYRDMLFVSVDACFDRATECDDPSVMITSVTFTIPEKVRTQVAFEVANRMNGSVKGIVWLSHIAFKEIDDASRMAMMAELCRYGLPVTLFAGHTHVELNHYCVDEENPERILAEIYTLPAVTSGRRYRYYNVTFGDGRVVALDKRLEAEIELD